MRRQPGLGRAAYEPSYLLPPTELVGRLRVRLRVMRGHETPASRGLERSTRLRDRSRTLGLSHARTPFLFHGSPHTRQTGGSDPAGHHRKFSASPRTDARVQTRKNTRSFRQGSYSQRVRTEQSAQFAGFTQDPMFTTFRGHDRVLGHAVAGAGHAGCTISRHSAHRSMTRNAIVRGWTLTRRRSVLT